MLLTKLTLCPLFHPPFNFLFSVPSSTFSLCNMSYQTGDCVYLPPDCYQFPVKPHTTPKEHSEVSKVCIYMYMYVVCANRGGGTGLADPATAGPMFWQTMVLDKHQVALSVPLRGYIATYWGPGSTESLFTSLVAMQQNLKCLDTYLVSFPRRE